MALSFLRTKLIVRHAKKQLYQSRRNAGYVVLIPEIGEDGDTNTLLGDDGLPEFSDVTIEKCIAAISRQSLEYERGVAQVEQAAPGCRDAFQQVFVPLELLDAPLELTWGMAKALYLGNSCLMPTASYRNIHERAHKARSTKFNSVPIFRAAVNEKNKLKKLTDEEQRLLDKYILEGKLNGLDETGAKRERLHGTLAELQQQKRMFREKVQAATDMFAHNVTDERVVRALPASLAAAMTAGGDGPWRLTLRPHVYEPFLQYCPDRDLRWNAWQAHVRRCSGYGDKELETSTHLEKIRGLRTEQAKLLGYETFVDMSMETKMAGSAENVYAVLDCLLEHARPAQDRELDALQAFARERGFDGKLEHWDVPYWQRKQRRTLYDFDEDEIREYFPLPRVVRGLFELCRTLFDVRIEERPNVATWHRDVKFYDVFEGGGAPVAGFYLDPYARQHDKIRVFDDAGWHVALRNRCASTGASPLSALIFNFQPPTAERPSLLSFGEVEVLFQKFGHALRHLLTTVDRAEVAGLSNVEWDAAETCGHVLAHWLRDERTVAALGEHHGTGEPLPATLAVGLRDARAHMAGYTLCRELYLARLDLRLHSSAAFWRDVVQELWPRHHALPFDKYDSHPLSFGKVVSEEWAAAYYCRLWSRMLAADVRGAWDEDHDTQTVGARYRGTWLARGGAVAPGELFRRFRGRDPSPHALLADLGLAKPAGKLPQD